MSIGYDRDTLSFLNNKGK